MRSVIRAAALFLVTLLLAVPTAQAQSVKVEQPWARATAPHAQTAAVYLTLTAHMVDRLIGGRTPIASRVQVHQTIQDSGVMGMIAVPGGLQLPPGKKVTLAPGGYHLMLTGLSAQLRPGTGFPLTLHFASEPPVTVTVLVGAAGAILPPVGTMHMPLMPDKDSDSD
jgi:copper(I)-binding protein